MKWLCHVVPEHVAVGPQEPYSPWVPQVRLLRSLAFWQRRGDQFQASDVDCSRKTRATALLTSAFHWQGTTFLYRTVYVTAMMKWMNHAVELAWPRGPSVSMHHICSANAPTKDQSSSKSCRLYHHYQPFPSNFPLHFHSSAISLTEATPPSPWLPVPFTVAASAPCCCASP